jgi:TonB family protein
MSQSSGASIRTDQVRKLALALVLMVIAIAIFLVRDWDDLFGPATSYGPSSETAGDAARRAPRRSAKVKQPATESPESSSMQGGNAPFPAIVVKRTPVPPYEVEVFSGSGHRKVQASRKAFWANLKGAPQASAPSANGNASADVALGGDAPEHVNPVVASGDLGQPAAQLSYPLFAPRMKVEGTVILEVHINADGTVQDSDVLSGPSILAVAAQQAIREWRFKPYYENRVPVATNATVTVNFTISRL